MPDALSDEALMTRVREGDLDPAGLLFERHSPTLYRFFLHTTRREALSQDLVQDVFVRVLRYRASYRPGASVRAWLLGIARNRLADHWAGTDPDDPSVDDLLLPSADPSPLGDLEAEEQRRRLDAALGRLPAAQRELLVLSHIAGASYAEIAALYTITVNAARVRVCRALQALRTVYLPHEA
ncbi:MAG: sigma-70 family RNA polymerase sigma factor [Bacteroidota bacterium]